MSPSYPDEMQALAEYLYQYVGDFRREHGRPSLDPESEATSVAMEHSANQARRGQLMDRTLKGTTVAAAVTDYRTVVDLEARVSAGNETPETVAKEVVRRWANDEASARAMLDPIFGAAGFGAGRGDGSVYATAILCSDLGWLQQKKRRLTSM